MVTIATGGRTSREAAASTSAASSGMACGTMCTATLTTRRSLCARSSSQVGNGGEMQCFMAVVIDDVFRVDC